MPSIVITDGVRTVTVEEAPDVQAVKPVGMDFLPDANGNLVLYERAYAPREVPVVGRVKTKTEALHLGQFVLEGSLLYLTERDGTITSGWRIRTDPVPDIRRKDGDSADWNVNIRLWRVP